LKSEFRKRGQRYKEETTEIITEINPDKEEENELEEEPQVDQKITSNNNNTQIQSGNRDWLINFLLQLVNASWNYFWSSLYYIYPNLQTQPELDETARSRMQAFQLYISVPYDSTNSNHESLLLQLWKLSYPNVALRSRISSEWKKLGFQGTDPSTDFRGGGVFSLNNLLYFAEHYPQKYEKFLRGSHHKESYPFAITGMNITMLLMGILGFGMIKKDVKIQSKANFAQLLFISTDQIELDAERKTEPNSELRKKKPFEELYCICFDMFDEEWVGVQASYMDFPKVIATTRSKIEIMLQSTDIQSMRKKLHLK